MKYKYETVAQQAMEFAYKNDGRLPSERELCELCQISRITAKKALNGLKERGLVTRHVGRGTFIADGVQPPKVRVLLVSANLSAPLREALRTEARLFSEESGLSGIVCSEISEQVVREIQGPGAKVVVWPYSARLAETGAFAALNRQSGFEETAATIFRDYADVAPAADGASACVTLPFLLGCEVFAYHRPLAKKLGLDADGGPRDWNEILEWSARAQRDLSLPATACPQGVRPVVPIGYYLNASGGQDYLQTAAGGIGFDFRGGERWLAFFRELLLPERALRYAYSDPDPFSAGQTLFRYDMGMWLLDVKGRAARSIAAVPLPPAQAGERAHTLVQKNALAVVPGGDEEGAAAGWAFCRHLLSAPAQRRLWTSSSCLSANREVFAEQAARPGWDVFARCIRSGKALTEHPVRFGLVALLRQSFEQVVAGGCPPHEAAAKAREFADLLLRIEQERTWY